MGWLGDGSQRAGLPSLNGGGTVAAVPPSVQSYADTFINSLQKTGLQKSEDIIKKEDWGDLYVY